MISLFTVDPRVRRSDGRRELRHVPVLQDPHSARPHRRQEALRPDHTCRRAYEDGYVLYYD